MAIANLVYLERGGKVSNSSDADDDNQTELRPRPPPTTTTLFGREKKENGEVRTTFGKGEETRRRYYHYPL